MVSVMNPPLEYIDCSLPHEDMTLAEYRRTRVARRKPRFRLRRP
jgi:hypothetical protein